MRPCLALLLISCSSLLIAEDAPPRSLDDRLEITLFAEDPLLNTPTGIDVDSRGRVWVIESNTHFPPEGYEGHPTDRLLILEDTDGDGKAEAKPFVDGFTHSMSVAARPVWLDPISFDENDKPEDLQKHTQVFLATRREILLLEDTNGDDKCDKQTRLVHLETEGNYPHNGLAGFAFDGLGNMYFGFGENLGADYKIIGRDGTTYSGGGEGGNIYRVQQDGTKLKHWATGFWNPHANCVDAFGNLFSVDNDPDSLPPCRLLHIIEGGDYGYRYRNGRKGFHPFTCWNGEIPGTLPMVAGTGEAPSGILAYEHDAFPQDYLGNLIVTSWGDHRIDRFRLKRKGASFESVAEPFIVGGENFRPVGIALAPDGSLYLSDWVLRDYKLHGKGRVWRIRAKDAHKTDVDFNRITPELSHDELNRYFNSDVLVTRRLAAIAKQQKYQSSGQKWSEQKEFSQYRRRQWSEYTRIVELPELQSEVEEISVRIDKDDFFYLWRGMIQEEDSPFRYYHVFNSGDYIEKETDKNVIKQFLKKQWHSDWFRENTPITKKRQIERVRVGCMLEARRYFPQADGFPILALNSSSAKLKRLAVQWIAEEHLTELRPQVEALFNDPNLTPKLFLATLAALDMLEGNDPKEFDKTPPGKYVLPILKDDTKPANVRAIALRLVDPDDPELPPELVQQLIQSDDPRLREEAIRTAAMPPRKQLTEPLLKLALDPQADERLRAEATLGLARRMTESEPAKEAIRKLTKSDNQTIAREALRTLRKQSGQRPVEPFQTETAGKPDPLAGRRLFFHPNGPGCYKCHTVHGRGGNIGPDLSTIGGALSREKLIESIRKPSQEVAPQFTTWTMISTKGKTYTGMIVHENKGDTVLGLKDGTTIQLKTEDVEERSPQKTSVMPEKLEQQMTEREFEDLIVFLESLK